MITTRELANELDVTDDQVRVHADQLIIIDGEGAVFPDSAPPGWLHRGTYPVWTITLTAEAAATIRMIVAASRGSG